MGQIARSKYALKDIVQFRVANDILTGVIELADFPRSSRINYRSYDIFVEERGCSFKHVPESDVLKKF